MTSSLVEFVAGIPSALLKQYEYEESHVRSGDQLMHSAFLRVSLLLNINFVPTSVFFLSCEQLLFRQPIGKRSQ